VPGQALRQALTEIAADGATEPLERLRAFLAAGGGLERAVQEGARTGNLLRDVLDLMPMGVLIVDGGGAVLEANAAASERTGVDRSRLVGGPSVPYVGTVARRCDGTVTLTGGGVLHVSRRDLPSEPGAEVVVLRCVGEESDAASMRAEMAARLSELSTLGHRINNPLTVLIGRMQILRMRADSTDPALRKIADSVEEASRRIADDIRALSNVIKQIRRGTIDRIVSE
jgi:PAS domain-containing protein